jgi:hypothetical protein
MSVSLDTLGDYAPEFASDARAETYLERAASLLSPAFYQEQYVYACCLWAAHALTDADQVAAAIASGGAGASAVVGAVTSKTAGRQSESYAAGALNTLLATSKEQSVAWYQGTTYGRQLLALRGSRVPNVRFSAVG